MTKTIEVIEEGAPLLLAIKEQVASLVAQAEAYVIDSPEMHQIALETLTEIRNREVTIEAEREKISKPLHTAWTNTNAFFKKFSDPLATAKTVMSNKVLAYEAAERKKREAAEAAAAAERAAEQAKAEAELTAAAEAVAAGEPGAEDALEAAQVAAWLADTAVPVVAAGADLEKGGHARRLKWSGEVVDRTAFYRFLADNPASPIGDAVDIKAGPLNKFAEATKGSIKVPGVRFSSTETIAVRKGN